MLVSLYVYTYWKAQQGIGDTDTAFFLDVIQNTWHTGVPTTLAVRAFLNVYKFIPMDADALCAIDQTHFSTVPANILLGHANLVVYPLSAIAQVFGAERVAAFVTAVAFVALPALSYVFLRRRAVPAWLCLLFSLLVCLHPAWRISAEGWLYFDRLFMPFALAFGLMLHQAFTSENRTTGGRMLLISLVVVTGSLIHERGALLMLLVAVSHLIFYRRAPSDTVRFTFLLAVALVLYLLIYTAFQRNVDNAEVYKGFLDIRVILQNVFRPGLIKLIVFNCVFILLAFFFRWRAALIALITILPNVIVSIGGAEKDGWITHYHSFYFPFVICAGAVGLAALYEREGGGGAKTARRPIAKAAGGTMTLLLIGATLSFLNPYGAQMSWGYNFVKEGIWRPLNDLYLIDPKFSSNGYETARADRLVASIVPGATVSFMPPFNVWKLYQNHNPIQVFPVGLGVSEYLLLTFEKAVDGTTFFDFVGVAGPAEHRLKARQCVTQKVWAAGYKPVMEINHYMLLRR
jgi:hypothetical protein